MIVSFFLYIWFFIYSLCLALKDADFFKKRVFLRLPNTLCVAVVIFHIICFVICFGIMIGTIGMFARGEMSPLPWIAFNTAHGLLDAFITIIIILTTDLWALWIPSQLWIGFVKKHKYEYFSMKTLCTKPVFIMARIINILFGLLIISENNIIYRSSGLFGYFFTHH